MRTSFAILIVLCTFCISLITACGGQSQTAKATDIPPPATQSKSPTTEAGKAPTGVTTKTSADPTTTTSTLKVGLVTDTGSVNDGTFNEFAHKGAERATRKFGFHYSFIETQNQADYDKNIQTFINEQFDVIITVGFLIQNATLAAAQANPTITFIGVDQFYPADDPTKSASNLIGLQFREDQSGFLAGAIAGMMTKSGVIGIVAGQEIPPVKKFRNSFINGAKYVNPDVNVLDVYVPSFTDSATGASNAQQMIGEGADVIFGAGGHTGSGAIRAAAEAGIFVIGVDQDEFNTTFGGGTSPGAEKILTSATKRVDVAVYDQLQNIANRKFTGGGIAIYEAANDGVGYADFHQAADSVPDAVKQRLKEILGKLADGSLTTGVDPVSGDPDPNTVPKSEPFTR